MSNTQTPTKSRFFNEQDVVRAQQNIAKDGYTRVSVNPLVSSDIYSHHYTIGLTNMGLPEIFLSGRLPSNVAYAIMEKLVGKWKGQSRIRVGLFTNFIKMTGGGKVPAMTQYVDATVARFLYPDFLDMMEEVIPGASNNLVQILWPDDRGQLPDGEWYTKDPDYRQVLLPTWDSEEDRLKRQYSFFGIFKVLAQLGAGDQTLDNFIYVLKNFGLETNLVFSREQTAEEKAAPATEAEQHVSFRIGKNVVQGEYLVKTLVDFKDLTVAFPYDPATSKIIKMEAL